MRFFFVLLVLLSSLLLACPPEVETVDPVSPPDTSEDEEVVFYLENPIVQGGMWDGDGVYLAGEQTSCDLIVVKVLETGLVMHADGCDEEFSGMTLDLSFYAW
jgi:hypothetical protein